MRRVGLVPSWAASLRRAFFRWEYPRALLWRAHGGWMPFSTYIAITSISSTCAKIKPRAFKRNLAFLKSDRSTNCDFQGTYLSPFPLEDTRWSGVLLRTVLQQASGAHASPKARGRTAVTRSPQMTPICPAGTLGRGCWWHDGWRGPGCGCRGTVVAAACPEGTGCVPLPPGHLHRWSCHRGQAGLPSGNVTPAAVWQWRRWL